LTTSGPTCATSPLRTEYVYDDGHLIGEYAPNLIDHTEILWLADTPIAVLKRRPGSTDGGPVGGGASTPWTGMQAGGVDIYFIHPDHLDTPRALVNANDQPIWLWDSAPFGDTAANEQPTGGLPNFTFNLRFPGQQYDRETGTHYNYFRDYEAGSGRYVQSDPIGLWGGIASFSYVNSDPVSNYDPLGWITVRNPNTGRFEADPCGPTGYKKKKIPQSLKNKVRKTNEEKNDGKLLCDECGVETIPGPPNQSGVTPPDSEPHIDHILPEVAGGTLDEINLRNTCRKCNLLLGSKGH